ncbi:hypothetical protein EPO05_01975 [Patescibacteria group bacterium]|nr:MAG: hypothetical protein EPO05_01975 [Patescibacteria group bacterium]
MKAKVAVVLILTGLVVMDASSFLGWLKYTLVLKEEVRPWYATTTALVTSVGATAVFLGIMLFLGIQEVNRHREK